MTVGSRALVSVSWVLFIVILRRNLIEVTVTMIVGIAGRKLTV